MNWYLSQVREISLKSLIFVEDDRSGVEYFFLWCRFSNDLIGFVFHQNLLFSYCSFDAALLTKPKGFLAHCSNEILFLKKRNFCKDFHLNSPFSWWGEISTEEGEGRKEALNWEMCHKPRKVGARPLASGATSLFRKAASPTAAAAASLSATTSAITATRQVENRNSPELAPHLPLFNASRI